VKTFFETELKSTSFCPIMRLFWQLLYRVYKAKAVPLHAMKALRGRGGIAPSRSPHYVGVSGQHRASAAF
jgi:hypothetical protein